MKKALAKYSVLIFLTASASSIFISAYIINFHSSKISKDPSDWAHFATYLSGTVGVATLIATLIALIFTTHQQNELIKQQETMIESQKDQISISDRHQRKIEAYSRVEKILPHLINSLAQEMGRCVVNDLKLRYTSFHNNNFTEGMLLYDFFTEENALCRTKFTKDPFFSNFWKEYLKKAYNLAVFMADCINDAEELRHYILDITKDQSTAIACSLAYMYSSDKFNKEAERAAEILKLPKNYSSTNTPEEMWQNIGRAQHTLPEQRQ